MSSDKPFLTSASILAPQVDGAMIGLLFVSGFMLLLVASLIIIFCVRYRKKSNSNRALSKSESNLLEYGWTIGTMVVFLSLFACGVVIFFAMHVAPLKALPLTVVGKQWMWKFQHPNGKRELNELHIPLGQPIVLKMISQDVIHSLFLPDFRLKQDVLPGRYTEAWLEPTVEGEYRIFCTQYCGTMHAQMIGRVFVLSKKDYEDWLQKSDTGQENLPPNTISSRGEELFIKLSCAACHNEKTSAIGPPLYGLFGSKVKLSTNEVIVADDNYIRESILYPNAKIVKGFKPLMPSFLGRISEEDLLDLIAYIKALKKP